MIDYRIDTFLKLCETMNYRKTAEILNMTQPAVTQHIHYLENYYQVKLFHYSGKKLTKTEEGERLEEYARSVIYNETAFKNALLKPAKQKIRLGATKTIGDYCIDDLAGFCLSDDQIQFELMIDNTENLLRQLDDQKLDFLIVEGYFDKFSYDYRLFKEEELVGICAREHSFADREICIEELFQEHLILREQGSGTRKVLEHFMREKNYTISSFKRTSVVSSLHLIRKMVSENKGISFVYRSVAEENEDLSCFRIKGEKVMHEFNYVFLKNSKALQVFQDLKTAQLLKKFR